MVAQLSEVADQTFDYIVIGGGTAGLTVAARLVEDPSISVAVLEAGEPNFDDPLILLCGQFAATWGNPKYDWYNMTVPQKHVDNRRCQWSSGKGLGGSSGMNFAVWSKPHAVDVDAWEKLGNKGWNWNLFQKYALRAEHCTGATEDQHAEFVDIAPNLASVGASGPIKTTVSWTHAAVEQLFMDTLEGLGVPDARDAYGGDNTGKYNFTTIMDRTNKWNRSYSATAYYLPNKDKPNFKVLTEAYAARIIFADEKDGDNVVATGVEFTHKGQTYTVHARKEVILSAGTVMSPAVLERSGIGRKDVLDQVGVPLRINLPGVGENVQDHVYACITYELEPGAGFTSFDQLKDPEFAKEQARLNELDQKNMYRMGFSTVGYLPLDAVSPDTAATFREGVSQYIAKENQDSPLPPGRSEQYNLQLQCLGNNKVADVQFLVLPCFMTYLNSTPDPNKIYMSIMVILQHPFSRGTVHITTKDPLQPPAIDPHTFENPYDLELLVEGFDYVRRMATLEPFKSGIVGEVDPGADKQYDEDIKTYIKKTLSTVHHPIGTLSMLPREKNGVVDTELKVYGTKNVRVADASVAPLHVTAHTQSVAYAVGEILADILKNGHL